MRPTPRRRALPPLDEIGKRRIWKPKRRHNRVRTVEDVFVHDARIFYDDAELARVLGLPRDAFCDAAAEHDADLKARMRVWQMAFASAIPGKLKADALRRHPDITRRARSGFAAGGVREDQSSRMSPATSERSLLS